MQSLTSAWSSMLHNGVEVVSVEVVGSTNHGRGHARWMEHCHNERHEYGQGRCGGGRDPSHEQRCAGEARIRPTSGGTRGRSGSVPRAGTRSVQTSQSELAMRTEASQTGSFPQAGNSGKVRPSVQTTNRSITVLKSDLECKGIFSGMVNGLLNAATLAATAVPLLLFITD